MSTLLLLEQMLPEIKYRLNKKIPGIALCSEYQNYGINESYWKT